MWRYIAIIAFLASVSCSPVHENGVAEKFVGAVTECINNDTTLCLKEKALKFTEKLAIAKDMSIFEGISLVNVGSARSGRSYEPLAEDPKTRESQLEERIADYLGDFLENHVLQLRLAPENENESRDLEEEGRGKKKKKKIKKLLPILLLLKLKLAALIPIFLGIIAIVAIKAVFLGKIAFALKAFSMIKSLLNKGGGSSSTSTYSAPPHQEEHPGYSYEPAQGWGRKANDAQSLAYSGQLQK